MCPLKASEIFMVLEVSRKLHSLNIVLKILHGDLRYSYILIYTWCVLSLETFFQQSPSYYNLISLLLWKCFTKSATPDAPFPIFFSKTILSIVNCVISISLWSWAGILNAVIKIWKKEHQTRFTHNRLIKWSITLTSFHPSHNV